MTSGLQSAVPHTTHRRNMEKSAKGLSGTGDAERAARGDSGVTAAGEGAGAGAGLPGGAAAGGAAIGTTVVVGTEVVAVEAAGSFGGASPDGAGRVVASRRRDFFRERR